MTEAEWLASTDPQPMLEFLRGKPSDRKLRLFACACCRRVWHLLHKRGRKAVTITEEFVDGIATASALEEAREGLMQNTYWLVIPRSLSDASQRAARHAAAVVQHAAANNVDANMCWREVVEARLTEDEEQDPLTVQIGLSRLFREVFGNPFRPVVYDPSWLSWNNGTVLKLARMIYEDRAFGGLPVLADALEEAGCTNTDLLAHCRRPGEHVLASPTGPDQGEGWKRWSPCLTNQGKISRGS